MRSRLRGALPLLFDDVDDVAGGELGVEVVAVAAATEAEGLDELDVLDFFFFSWKRGFSVEIGYDETKAAEKEREQRAECKRLVSHLLPAPNWSKAIKEAHILEQIRIQPEARLDRKDRHTE